MARTPVEIGDTFRGRVDADAGHDGLVFVERGIRVPFGFRLLGYADLDWGVDGDGGEVSGYARDVDRAAGTGVDGVWGEEPVGTGDHVVAAGDRNGIRGNNGMGEGNAGDDVVWADDCDELVSDDRGDYGGYSEGRDGSDGGAAGGVGIRVMDCLRGELGVAGGDRVDDTAESVFCTMGQ